MHSMAVVVLDESTTSENVETKLEQVLKKYKEKDNGNLRQYNELYDYYEIGGRYKSLLQSGEIWFNYGKIKDIDNLYELKPHIFITEEFFRTDSSLYIIELFYKHLDDKELSKLSYANSKEQRFIVQNKFTSYVLDRQNENKMLVVCDFHI